MIVNVDDVRQVTDCLQDRSNWGETMMTLPSFRQPVKVANICPLCASLVANDEYSIKLHSDVHISVASRLQRIR